MATMSISIDGTAARPRVDVQVMPADKPAYCGARYAVIQLDDDTRVIVPGFDGETATYLRALGDSIAAALKEFDAPAAAVEPVGEEVSAQNERGRCGRAAPWTTRTGGAHP